MKKILLAIQDRFLIGIYANQLRKNGYSISIASDGDVVVNKVKIIIPDLVVIDTLLPKLGGLNVLKSIREDLQTKDLKVAMLSNLLEKEEMNQWASFGALEYFAKAEHTAQEIADGIKQILS